MEAVQPALVSALLEKLIYLLLDQVRTLMTPGSLRARHNKNTHLVMGPLVTVCSLFVSVTNKKTYTQIKWRIVDLPQ